jgi:large subunit ribosomal protein L1
MAQHGKRYRTARALVDPAERYVLDQALELLKQTSSAKFDETIDIAVRLGVNPKQADQMVRGAVSLPYSAGKAVRVLVFAQGEGAKEALEAGAEFVGADELIAKIADEGWTDFDKAIATRPMMPKVAKLGRILGPRGLMPNPKDGTVCGPEDVAKVVREVKGGRVDFRVDKAGIVHAPIGKASMGPDQLRANVLALLQTLTRMKPSTAKGTYLRTVAISSTMGPGIRIDPNEMTRISTERGEA